MNNLEVITDPNVETVFTKYPDFVKEKMDSLRKLVIETARETEEVTRLTEMLKWGEPSFVTKHGSTLRMDWKEKSPNQYALYFQCTSRLVATFKRLFSNTFQFEGNRAIVFEINQEIPVLELKECIKAALRYHKVKHEITLGI